MLKIKGKSHLIGKIGRFVGYAYTIEEGNIYKIMLYKYKSSNYIICLSLVEKQESLKDILGVDIDTTMLIPYAQRELTGPFDEVKCAMTKCYPEVKFEWVSEIGLNCLHLEEVDGSCKRCNLGAQ